MTLIYLYNILFIMNSFSEKNVIIMGNLTKNQLKLIDILISNKNLFSEFCKLNSLDDMYTYSKKIDRKYK